MDEMSKNTDPPSPTDIFDKSILPSKRQHLSSPTQSQEDVAAAVKFFEKEKERRRIAYRRSCDRKKQLAKESVADRCKRAKLESSPEKPSVLSPEDLIGNEILRIVKFDPTSREIEWRKKFRWIQTMSDKKFVLQYCMPEEKFVDLVYIQKSTIKNAGYGLFAARDLPQKLPFLIYLGRVVKHVNPGRRYVFVMECNFVNKRNKINQWERRKKSRPPKYIDALMDDTHNKWTPEKEFHMGAHLINDPDYATASKHIKVNCVVNKLMELYTITDIKKNNELFINYNM